MNHALAAQALPAAPATGLLAPLPIGAARLEGHGFWGARQRLNATAIISHCEYWMERAGWLGNFDAAAEGRLPADRRGREFTDADVYKLVEAMSWELGRTGEPALEQSITAIVARVASAQEPDGYLNTQFGRPGQAPRYSDMEWGHELYNYGHLLQAAVARARTTGRDALFDVAQRVADHVCAEFGPDARNAVCGHPEIEVGLAEFARLTGEAKYRDQAALFIERRGHGLLADIEWGRSYYQDDIPVREAEVMRGHAVRALYLAAAAVDVAVDTGDTELFEAMERQWSATIARRTYLTGGMGSHHQDEAFGQDFELPSDRAYCETCAGVALVQLSWRLLLATGDPRYGDMIERVLYNVVATSPSDDGRAFFYSNTLHQRSPGQEPSADEQVPRASSSLRAPWFAVSCCPPNVARTLASLGAYIATATEAGVQLHQYAESVVSVGAIVLRVSTRYPAEGEITVDVVESDRAFELALRVPAWAAGATVVLAGETRAVDPGMAVLSVRAGDRVVLRLPLEPRFTFPDERIDAVRGTVAVERGPVVHCLESVDLAGGVHVDAVVVSTAVAPVVIEGSVVVKGRVEPAVESVWAYGPGRSKDAAAAAIPVRLVPYHSWANRGPGTMRVWLRSSAD